MLFFSVLLRQVWLDWKGWTDRWNFCIQPSPLSWEVAVRGYRLWLHHADGEDFCHGTAAVHLGTFQSPICG